MSLLKIAKLRQVTKILVRQVSEKKIVKAPTIMVRSVGLQVDTNAPRNVQKTKSVASSSYCPPIPILNEDDDDIVAVPIQADAELFTRPRASSGQNSVNQIRRVPPLPTRQTPNINPNSLPRKPTLEMKKDANCNYITFLYIYIPNLLLLI